MSARGPPGKVGAVFVMSAGLSALPKAQADNDDEEPNKDDNIVGSKMHGLHGRYTGLTGWRWNRFHRRGPGQTAVCRAPY